MSSGNLFLPSYLISRLAIRKGEPDISAAAIEATIQLLAKGGSFEHQKLLNADVFSVAWELHDRRSQRQLSLELLRAVVSHLSYLLLTYEDLATEMCSLFESVENYSGFSVSLNKPFYSDPDLATTLYQTWSNDARACENLPELLPLFLEKLRNPSVAALLRQVGPSMVHQLVLRKRLDIIVKALK